MNALTARRNFGELSASAALKRIQSAYHCYATTITTLYLLSVNKALLKYLYVHYSNVSNVFLCDGNTYRQVLPSMGIGFGPGTSLYGSAFCHSLVSCTAVTLLPLLPDVAKCGQAISGLVAVSAVAAALEFSRTLSEDTAPDLVENGV